MGNPSRKGPSMNGHDHDYRSPAPLGATRFHAATAGIVLANFGAVYAVNLAVEGSTPPLRPQIEEVEPNADSVDIGESWGLIAAVGRPQPSSPKRAMSSGPVFVASFSSP
jgi:hypothetical protein